MRYEGQPSNGDVAVDEAYDYLGITHDFFWKEYQRDSLDNKGLILTGTVHYGREYQNAFWNGQQMVFGDGDGEIFNRFTIAIDVVARAEPRRHRDRSRANLFRTVRRAE